MKNFGTLEKDNLSDSELDRIYEGLRVIEEKTKRAKQRIVVLYFFIIASVIVGLISNYWVMAILLAGCAIYFYILVNIKCPRCHEYFHDWNFDLSAEDNMYFIKVNSYCKNCKLALNELPENT